jgi:hypothetical protein
MADQVSPTFRPAFPSSSIISERPSPSRVRFAAPNNGAPLTAPGRSGQHSSEEGKAHSERLPWQGTTSPPFWYPFRRHRQPDTTKPLWIYSLIRIDPRTCTASALARNSCRAPKLYRVSDYNQPGGQCFFRYEDLGLAGAVSGINGGTFSGLRFGALFIDCCTSSTYLNFARDFIRRNWLWLIPIAARISSSDSPSR